MSANIFCQILRSTGVDWALGGGAPDLGFVVRLGARPGEREADQRAPPNLGTISEMQLIGNREIHAKVFKRSKKALQSIN